MGVAIWLLGCLASFAAFTHGFCGFGFGILLMAGASFVTPNLERVSVVATLFSILISATIVFGARQRLRVDWPAIGLLLSGSLLGLPLGYAFLCRYESLPAGRFVLGLVLLAFAVANACRPSRRLALPAWSGPLFGLAGGFLGGAFATGGPPLVIFLYLREDDPRVAKRTLQVVFLLTSLARLGVVLLGGRGVSGEQLGAAGLLALPVLTVAWAGHALSRRVSSTAFVRVVYGLLALAGAINVVRALQAWRCPG